MGDLVLARQLRVRRWRREADTLVVLGSCKGLHERVITERVEVSGTVNPRTTKSDTTGNAILAGV